MEAHRPWIGEHSVGQKEDPADVIVCILKKDNLFGIPFGIIENYGDANFVLTLKSSGDNGDTDPYAAVNFRVDGAGVVSITVVPNGRVVFSIEATTEDYLKFEATPTAGYGRLVLCNWGKPFVLYSKHV